MLQQKFKDSFENLLKNESALGKYKKTGSEFLKFTENGFCKIGLND